MNYISLGFEKMMVKEKELKIGIGNVESVLFEDLSVWTKIPEMRHFRDQWAISKISPALRPTGMAAMIDFLSSCGGREEDALSEHFGRRVTIDNADRRCVANLEFNAKCDPPDLNEMSAYTGFGCFRKEDKVYITFWR
jgi:hypothetical protein